MGNLFTMSVSPTLTVRVGAASHGREDSHTLTVRVGGTSGKEKLQTTLRLVQGANIN